MAMENASLWMDSGAWTGACASRMVATSAYSAIEFIFLTASSCSARFFSASLRALAYFVRRRGTMPRTAGRDVHSL